MATHNTNPDSDLVPIDQAVAYLLAASPAPPSQENIRLADGLGRVLAQPLTSPVEVPSHDNSAVDGYAIRTSDPRDMPVNQTIAAGATPQVLEQGAAARIFTGAPVPEGADAVVMQEQCEAHGDRVVLPDAVEAGQNIRLCGENVQTGQVILDAGVRLRPQELGHAASVGLDTVSVYRRLRVAMLTTGDELAEPGRSLAPGELYDSNGPQVAALLRVLGYECLPPVHLRDDFEATRDALAQAAEHADVVITAGGVSVGDRDHVKPAVEALGQLGLWRVGIKPGKPFAYGTVGDTPFMGLPGNPVSVFVTFLMLARPFLARFQGRQTVRDRVYHVPAAFDHVRPAPVRTEYLRARLAGGQAEVYPHQGSGVLSSVSWADGLVRIEPGQVVRAGDAVPYLPFSELLT